MTYLYRLTFDVTHHINTPFITASNVMATPTIDIGSDLEMRDFAASIYESEYTHLVAESLGISTDQVGTARLTQITQKD